MKSITNGFLFIVIIVITMNKISAQFPNPLELNTAANGINTTFPVGSFDSNWYVAYGNAIQPTSSYIQAKVVGSCHPIWYNSPFSNANWIAYDFGAGCNHVAQGCIDLYFRRDIFLPATNICGLPISESFCLGMDFFADNCVYDITVNGIKNYQYNNPIDPYYYYGFQNITTINLCNGWQPGVNTLIAHIKSCPSSEGFLAQANINIINNYFYRFSISANICHGETYLGYSTTGIYLDSLLSANGCDSIRTLNLTVLPISTNNQAASICQGETYEGYSTTGIHIDTLKTVNGCDSIRTLNLTVLPISTNNLTVSICQGEIYEGYSMAGIHIDTLRAANGCDSIRTLNLTVLPISINNQTISICQGETYEGHSTTGTHIDTLQATNGCDSIKMLNLTVLPIYMNNQTVSICQGEIYEGYSTTGAYTDTLQTLNGCDSIRTLNLTILPNSAINQTISICQGETYEGYSITGIHIDTLQASNGCDSIRTLHLTVLPISAIHQTVSVCEGEIYEGYSTTGTYIDTLQAANGCDSIIILNLIVAQSNFLGNDSTICIGNNHQLVSPSDNTTWFDNTISKTKTITETGEYWARIIDTNGCEIIDTVFIQFNVKLFVPNAFNPNSDGINDCFFPSFSETPINTYKLDVFDRWGNLIFTTNNPSDCWNGEYRGKKCNPGVYVYLLDLKIGYCEKIVLKGDVTLIKIE